MSRPKEETSAPEVLHRSAHYLALAKPPFLPTTSPTEERTLVSEAALLDPDAPRLHPSSRLDSPVSGVVVFARTELATRVLLEARRESRYLRTYTALSLGAPARPRGTWDFPVAMDPRDPRLRTSSADGLSGKDAQTEYRVVARASAAAMLALHPLTGRTHQLRVHASTAGVPLLGDTSYGGPPRITQPNGRVVRIPRVALHCFRVEVPDPGDRKRLLRFEAAIPRDLNAVWCALGGDPLDFSRLDDLPSV